MTMKEDERVEPLQNRLHVERPDAGRRQLASIPAEPACNASE